MNTSTGWAKRQLAWTSVVATLLIGTQTLLVTPKGRIRFIKQFRSTSDFKEALLTESFSTTAIVAILILGAPHSSAHGLELKVGSLNYYFFYGPSIKKILGRYTELTGHMQLPPLWALGNQQSRWSYYPDSMVEEVVKNYRERDLPLDVVHLDIDYMKTVSSLHVRFGTVP
jgi:alpha-glucosidase (family GH31 glycosyl hydrolase)